jgi:medium-chain acyl-[acyl-carrier-protein] hydrolase
MYCIPYAGGGTTIFRPWAGWIHPDVELRAIQLPGREIRLGEEPFTHAQRLAESLSEGLSGGLDKPYILFGHSMGSLLSYELTRCLRDMGRPLPLHLILSGFHAVHLPDPDPPIHHLPMDEFIEEIKRLNGTPLEIFESTELLDLVMPVIRSDFTLCETYQYEEHEPLDQPLTIYGGLDDSETSREQLEAWGERTRGDFKLRMFSGDHFYFLSNMKVFQEALNRDLEQILARLPSR